ncbi:MAG: hypothetical protein HZA52_15590 [Planctomycetes bacterium]|nr:hypothetical protein [Planctomycetota bacterium]
MSTGLIGDSGGGHLPNRVYKKSDIEAMGYPAGRLKRGVRMRFRQTPGEFGGRLYLCTENDVLRFGYDPTVDPDELTLEAYFPNDADEGIHDCQWYDLPALGAMAPGLKLMVVRDRESFSLVPAE